MKQSNLRASIVSKYIHKATPRSSILKYAEIIRLQLFQLPFMANLFDQLLDQQPSLKELASNAKTAKWYELGIQLELNGVDLAGCTDFTRMCQLWIEEKAEKATRRNLLNALEAIRQNNVVREYTEYLRQLLVSFL